MKAITQKEFSNTYLKMFDALHNKKSNIITFKFFDKDYKEYQAIFDLDAPLCKFYKEDEADDYITKRRNYGYSD